MAVKMLAISIMKAQKKRKKKKKRKDGMKGQKIERKKIKIRVFALSVRVCVWLHRGGTAYILFSRTKRFFGEGRKNGGGGEEKRKFKFKCLL